MLAKTSPSQPRNGAIKAKSEQGVAHEYAVKVKSRSFVDF